jgi:hypothetical protein
VFAASPESHPYCTITHTGWPLGRPAAGRTAVRPPAPSLRSATEPAGPAWYDERGQAPPPEEPGYGHGV